jgi:hypothetical protein
MVKVLEDLYKSLKLFVAMPFFDVEGQGQHTAPILPHRLVVDLHIVVEGFFIRQMEVVFLMVVGNQVMRCLFHRTFWLFNWGYLSDPSGGRLSQNDTSL